MIKSASSESAAGSPQQFWALEEHEVTKGLSPVVARQTYSAKKKKKKEEQPSSAAFLSSFSQQPFKEAFLSSLPQQPFSAAFSGFLSSFSQLPSSAIILPWSRHEAVVRGWWSAIDIILLWSGVGGQLLTSCCCGCGQGLVVSC